MSRPEHFEMLVLGSGEGGKYLAWHMAKSGHRTAVVERKLIGGSCPNTNCLPSKNEMERESCRSRSPRRSLWHRDGFHRHRHETSAGTKARDGRRLIAMHLAATRPAAPS
jgi:pyruvate/2-oxoglutarate dehydrogenase complex dihydrolipoamide dehydrogenase (E3) component